MLNRRDFLKTTMGATAAMTIRAPRVFAAPPEGKPKARADAMILLYMAGGMASTETFDPKHYEPFSPGIEAKRVLSTFPAIPTSLDGVKISEGLENIAKVMNKATLVRQM